jgi:hypothetical protein
LHNTQFVLVLGALFFEIRLFLVLKQKTMVRSCGFP